MPTTSARQPLRPLPVMDKMAYSINGENAHYGTPNNPCAPGRVPGGCAVAVAASLADFALGTNTGGSVRVPAAYCGIFGLRPSHGVVSAENIVPMAQMFDTVGNSSLAVLLSFIQMFSTQHYSSAQVFVQFYETMSLCLCLHRMVARDLATLPRVSDVLLPPVSTDTADAELRQPSRVIIPADCFRILGSSDDDHTYEILNACAAKVFGVLGAPVTAASLLVQPVGAVPGAPLPIISQSADIGTPTEFLLLKNMFDPVVERDPDFDLDIRDDVQDECSKFGVVKHIFVDKSPPPPSSRERRVIVQPKRLERLDCPAALLSEQVLIGLGAYPEHDADVSASSAKTRRSTRRQRRRRPE
ncbi:hypothetical protein ZWY2020_018071 [Hordeum vulgare]|nr:hypothetical protein ZWY2020_018071 [Hordeum vulgare]